MRRPSQNWSLISRATHGNGCGWPLSEYRVRHHRHSGERPPSFNRDRLEAAGPLRARQGNAFEHQITGSDRLWTSSTLTSMTMTKSMKTTRSVSGLQ